ncbi:MAG: SigE family RNA polymerase sigma factor [Nocardioidaceae bacterium]
MDAEAEAKFCAYVAARQRALLRTAYLLTGDVHSAEDLVQTALAKTYLTWGRIREPRAADAYVRRIMVNEHASWWRRAWRRNEHSTDVVPDEAQHVDLGDVVQRDALWELVGTLAPRQRAAVVLRFYEDMSEAETAHVLGCSIGTVKSQTSRALSTLRVRLGADAGSATGGAR